MKSASITIRTDKEFKDRCDNLFAELGMSTQTAINTFLHQALREKGMPFVPKINVDEIYNYVSGLPEAGRIDSKGHYVLPEDWNDTEDDIYEQLI